MGFSDLFKKKEEIKLADTEGWIDIELRLCLSKKSTKERAADAAVNLLEILTNTNAVYDEKNNFLACINPLLNIKTYKVYGNPKSTRLEQLRFFFFPEGLKEVSDKWVIALKPRTPQGKYHKYNLPDFAHDWYNLNWANTWIMDRYLGKGNRGNPSSFNPIFIHGKPAIEHVEGIFIVKYLVEDALKYARDKKIMKKYLGSDITSSLKSLKKTKKSDPARAGNKKEIDKWVSEVEKLLK